MKLRHAATLALVGWYLVMPPPAPENAPSRLERAEITGKVLLGAPLALWAVSDSFDTAAECRRARDNLKAEVDSHGGNTATFLKRSSLDAQMRYFAECIASDDPRLGGD